MRCQHEHCPETAANWSIWNDLVLCQRHYAAAKLEHQTYLAQRMNDAWRNDLDVQLTGQPNAFHISSELASPVRPLAPSDIRAFEESVPKTGITIGVKTPKRFDKIYDYADVKLSDMSHIDFWASSEQSERRARRRAQAKQLAHTIGLFAGDAMLTFIFAVGIVSCFAVVVIFLALWLGL